MATQRDPSAHEISHDIDMLTERVDTLEREVDQRLDKMNTKMDENTRASVTRHAEVMGAISNLSKSGELADQRNALQVEGVLANLKETTRRTDVLEANRLDTLQKLLEERKESGRHWVRYVVMVVITVLLSAGSGLLGHFVK
jgi:hypothetical protein